MGLPLKKFVCERIWKFIHEEVTKKIIVYQQPFWDLQYFWALLLQILQLFQLSLKTFEDCDDKNFIAIPCPNQWTVIS